MELFFSQSRLKLVFTSLHDTLIRISGRLKAENMKERVIKVLRVWTAWSVYPQQFINDLESIFCGNSSLTSARKPLADSKPVSLLSGAYDDDEDLDGEPLLTSKAARAVKRGLVEDDNDIDGEPLTAPSSSRQFPVSLVAADDEDEDIDGIPLA